MSRKFLYCMLSERLTPWFLTYHASQNKLPYSCMPPNPTCCFRDLLNVVASHEDIDPPLSMILKRKVMYVILSIGYSSSGYTTAK